mgnify:CR=1 FL=1
MVKRHSTATKKTTYNGEQALRLVYHNMEGTVLLMFSAQLSLNSKPLHVSDLHVRYSDKSKLSSYIAVHACRNHCNTVKEV